MIVRPGASSVEFVRARPSSRRCSTSAPTRRAPRRSGSATVGYTDGSRRRLKKKLDRLLRDAVPAFVTLTMGDGGPSGRPPGPVDVERMRKALTEQVRKQAEFGHVGWYWLRQWEERQWGRCARLHAAHLHLLAYHVGGWAGGDLTAFSGFVADAWGALGGGSVDIALARNPHAARNYLVQPEKVTAPEQRAALIAAFPEGTGGAWGVFRSENLPVVTETVEIEVSAAEFERLRADAIAEADATYRATGSQRRYRDLPQNRRTAVSVGCPERYLRERRDQRSEEGAGAPLRKHIGNGQRRRSQNRPSERDRAAFRPSRQGPLNPRVLGSSPSGGTRRPGPRCRPGASS